MKLHELSLWPKDATEAIAMQQSLRNSVRLQNALPKLELIAGIDVSYDIVSNISRAIVVVMRMDDFKPLTTIVARMPTEFPYIPGLLSFREIPVIINALGQLRELPDLLMVDGQGVAHPRRLGIAAHLGVLTDMPAIGVAKSRLCGKFTEPGQLKGDRSALTDKKELIGTVLRSKEKCNPLFISPGHKIDHETALNITLRCLTRYRLPEPTRIADKISKNPDELAP